MSDQEMKAAKFEVIERYQESKKALAVIELKLRTFGTALKGLGTDLEQTGRPSGPLHRVDLREVAALLDSHAEAAKVLAKCRAEMDSIGMQPL